MLNLFPNLLGAVAGGAENLVCTALKEAGLPISTQPTKEELERLIASADPETFERLKNAERLFTLEQNKLKFKDIADARKMAIQNRSKLVPVMGFFILSMGFLGLIGLFFIQFPETNRDLINIILGLIVGHSSNVVTFYFGSSDKK
jgi:hypothetical protein